MYESPSKEKELNADEIAAWNMWIYKTHGILPTQYHEFYEQGDTILYIEHIQDLLTIDKMWANKLEMQRKKEEAKQKHKENNPLKGGQHKQQGGGGFYGQTFRYK